MLIAEMNVIKLAQNVTDYTDYLDDVIDWNRVCESEPPVFEQKWLLVEEEAQELFEAFDKGDIKEFFKELCDLFVTSGYAAYMQDKHVVSTTHYQDDIEYLLACLEYSVYEKNAERTFFFTLQLMNSVNQDALNKTMKAVLRSNWSKIFLEQDAEAELSVAQMAYVGRYEGIYVQYKPTGCVLKDKNGKVIKPSSYKPYAEYL